MQVILVHQEIHHIQYLLQAGDQILLFQYQDKAAGIEVLLLKLPIVFFLFYSPS
jgi:hypothetical protein